MELSARSISTIFSIRQLWHYKVNEPIVSGDFILLRYKQEPTAYNGYSSKVVTVFAEVKKVCTDKNSGIYYNLDVYENGIKNSNCIFYVFQAKSIDKIFIGDDDFERAVVAYEKKLAKEAKLREEMEEQARKDAETQRIFQENLRKQEEADRAARIQAEEDRRAETMVITVGMWEDLMAKIAELESNVLDAEGMAQRAYRRNYNYDED